LAAACWIQPTLLPIVASKNYEVRTYSPFAT
jgi:hypothetical protein